MKTMANRLLVTLVLLASVFVVAPAGAVVDETKEVGLRVPNVAICPSDVNVTYTYLIEAYNSSDTLIFSLTPAGALAVTATFSLTGSFSCTDAITLTDADGAGVITIKGYEGNDARIVLDADEGDDNADTWTIESEASGNDLSVMNHTTEVLNLTSAGNLDVSGNVYCGANSYGVATGVSTSALLMIQHGTASLTGTTLEVDIPIDYSSAPTIILTNKDSTGGVQVSANSTGATFEVTVANSGNDVYWVTIGAP